MRVPRFLSSAAVLALILSGIAAPACAQGVPALEDLPGSADPGRIEERLMPPSSPALESEDDRPDAVPPALQEAEEGFILQTVEFEGNTAFSDDELRALLEKYLGRRADENYAQGLADYLTDHYRHEGYFLSKVFVQDIDPGRGALTFHVVEGYVERIEFQNEGVDLSLDWQNIVERTFAKIRGMKPLHGPTLERHLLLLNDLHGIAVETTLVPLTDMPDPPVGAIGMVASLKKDKRYSIIEFNNHGSVFTGPGQGIYAFNMGTPLNAFDNVKLQVLHAFPVREMRYVQAEYTMPVGTEGLSLTFSGNKSLFRPGDSLTPFDLKSASASAGISFLYPLIRSRAENLYLNGGFEARNSKTDMLGTEFFDDRLRVVHAGLSYEFMDASKGQNILEATLTQGLNILGARETGSIDLSRLEGHSDFTKAGMSATRYQYLPYDFDLVGGVTGQYAFSQLLSSEEFGYGGQGIGRAYDASEIVGDHGISGFIEARYSGIPPVENLNLKLQPYAFYDIGKVWNIENGQKPESGASAGGGLRFELDRTYTGNITVAQPLTRRVENPKHGDGDDPRFFFQISTRF